MSPLEHEAYDYAIREFHALALSGPPTPGEYRQLLSLVERELLHKHPKVPVATRSSAAFAGLDTALRELAPGSSGSDVLATPAAATGDVVIFTSVGAWNGLIGSLAKTGPRHLTASSRYRSASLSRFARFPRLG